MSNSQADTNWAAIWPTVVAALGMLMVGVAVVWPLISSPAQSFSEQQAKEYYDASLALQAAAVAQGAQHSSSMRQRLEPNEQDPDKALREAHQRFEEIKQQVTTQRERPATTSFWLKIVGGVLATIGAVGHYAKRG